MTTKVIDILYEMGLKRSVAVLILFSIKFYNSFFKTTWRIIKENWSDCKAAGRVKMDLPSL